MCVRPGLWVPEVTHECVRASEYPWPTDIDTFLNLIFFTYLFFLANFFGAEKQPNLENFSDECLGSGNDEGRSELR